MNKRLMIEKVIIIIENKLKRVSVSTCFYICW